MIRPTGAVLTRPVLTTGTSGTGLDHALPPGGLGVADLPGILTTTNRQVGMRLGVQLGPFLLSGGTPT
jgi:hypothetical protein